MRPLPIRTRSRDGDPSLLTPALDRLYREYDHPDAAADPVHIVRRYSDPADREVVGFCAASLAFGRVGSVLQSIEGLLRVMGPSPARYVRSFDPVRARPRLDPLVHRWTRGPDLAALLLILQHMLADAGSIEAFFLRGDDPATEHIGPALEAFCAAACAVDPRPAYGRMPRRPGVWYFFPRPSKGSGCKRLNLFLRWMVRADRVDLGVWRGIDPARLIVPLDTHVIRVGRCLGLTRYRSPGWNMAVEITRALRRLDPADPVRYDFALCHLGMMNACGFSRPWGDDRCPLRGACRPAAGRARPSRVPSARR